MFPVLQIGPLSVQAPALFLLGAVWVGLYLVEKTTDRFQVSFTELNNLVFYGAIAFLAGARLIFLLRYPNVFLARPLSALSLSPLLLDWEGGLLVGVLAAVVVGQRKGMRLWPTLDTLVPLFAAVAVGAGIARLASGDGYGLPTELPWAIPLWGAERHPTQAYEALAALVILTLLWRRLRSQASRPGEFFLRFLALASSANLVIDTLREDTPLLLNGLHMFQIASWLVLALSLVLLSRESKPDSA